MLSIEISGGELFDEKNEEFINVKSMILQLEHSLVSISKWESKWKKPFLHSEKTEEESLDYIKCMTINHNVPDYVYKILNGNDMKQIMDYIADPMTATTFPQEITKKFNREIVTAERIYYWMIAQQIPFECRKWHLNKLITLIKVCALENTPPKKMSKKDILARNSALNAARKAKLNTRG